MAKNYKKIYNRFIKIIEDEANRINKFDDNGSSNIELLTKIENLETVSTLEWLLSLRNEVEGKYCQMLHMNEKEFKKWKKQIQK